MMAHNVPHTLSEWATSPTICRVSSIVLICLFGGWAQAWDTGARQPPAHHSRGRRAARARQALLAAGESIRGMPGLWGMHIHYHTLMKFTSSLERILLYFNIRTKSRNPTKFVLRVGREGVIWTNFRDCEKFFQQILQIPRFLWTSLCFVQIPLESGQKLRFEFGFFLLTSPSPLFAIRILQLLTKLFSHLI